MTTATVTTTFDAGQPETLTDEHGFTWRNEIDNTDGTFAVERESYPSVAGVARWNLDGTVTIYPKEDGSYYGVNCTEEYVVEGGEWVENVTEEV